MARTAVRSLRMGKPVVHFEIHGKNSEGLFRFYAEIFGWTVDADNPLKYGMVETQAGKGIAGGMCASEMGPTVLVYIEVEDPQAYLDRIDRKSTRLNSSH